MGKTSSMSNRYFDIKRENGAITSLKAMQDDRNTEFVWEGNSFGNVHLKAHTASGHKIILNTDEEKEPQDNHGLELSTSFELENDRVIFSIKLENHSEKSMEVTDLAIPFPMNSRFAWGESASERVIRHSFISGHNSYIFFTRCDGKGPYLLFLPLDGAKFEFFDRFDDKSKEYKLHDAPAKHYRAYIHSKEEGSEAKSKGCKWRQENTSLTLTPKEKVKYSFAMLWADNYDDIREELYENHLIDIEVIPGMTIPTDLYARICLNSKYNNISIGAEYPEQTKIVKAGQDGNKIFYDAYFGHLGENKLTLSYGDGRQSILEFFITEPIETLINKRSKFIKETQHKDETKWYNGLLGEWSNDTSVLLGPDNYDRIGGWRIYEVTCDDPGLSKPAFMSGKNAIFPDQDEVEALELYIDNFVWGGLQRTEDEEFAYGIYGIPDWHVNRNSEDDGPRGRLHIWRIYDYPHIFLTYYNMYLIGRNFSSIKLNKPKEVYLERAYRTALAMFTIPDEIVDWSAYKTGLYNELVIEEIIEELLAVGEKEKSMRLRFHWEKKVRYFINECTDVFGSEYPFDTTGFETTHALANYALNDVTVNPEKDEKAYAKDKTIRFLENQMSSNIACRGWLEPAYYLLGSDYRGCSTAYTLSYMSQMGGWAIMDYALSFSDDPYKYLRLGYASILSSWALMNTGTPDTDYGYWYSGEQNDGAAGGGFEPAPYGETWLNQPHSRGSWYYSCEIDLGYCGALRAAATVLSFDDKFGLFCFGGSLEQEDSTLKIMPRDGIRQRFGIVKDNGILNITLDKGHFSKENPIIVDRDINKIILTIDTKDVRGEIGISISAIDAKYRVLDQGEKEIGFVDKDTKILSINSDQDTKTIMLVRESN
ncbi:MAG TPA: DUF5695 domain-containing protein [Clostridia bacterium]|nr:DUF5695 domain-containing protein [Clostridia bacterium]